MAMQSANNTPVKSITYGEYLSWVDGYLYNQIGNDISMYQLDQIKNKLSHVRTSDEKANVGYTNKISEMAQGGQY